MENIRPSLIITCHSFTDSFLLFNEVQNESNFLFQFEKMAEKLGIPLVNKLNYQVTGSLSQWGKERNIPVLTIESPRGEKWFGVKENFVMTLKNFLEGQFNTLSSID
jgi:hypothetical protein